MQSQVYDPIIYDRVSKEEFKETPFLERQMLNVQDSNMGNYSTHQVVFDSQAISSSGRWLDYSESYLSFPVFMCASASGPALDFADAGGVHADYLLGLKSGSHQLIHSITLDYNGSNVIQPNGFVNMLTNYNMVSNFSQEDVRKLNASIYFNPPTDDSWIWSPAEATSFGVGLCDNNNFPQTVGHTLGECGARTYRGNRGFLENQKAMVGSFAISANAHLNAGISSADNATAIMLDSVQNTQYVNKNRDVAGCHVKQFMACIRLKDIHDFFKNLPLLRAAQFRLVLNINNSSFVVNKSAYADAWNITLLDETAGPVLSLAQTPSLANGTNPMMIASCFGTGALTSSAGACIPSVAARNITCSVSVGTVLHTDHRTASGITNFIPCRWYVPSYVMTPQYVSKYTSIGTKKVEFEDFLCIQVKAKPGQFTQTLTPSLKNVLRVIVVPHCSTEKFMTVGGVGGVKCAQVASPFCDNFTFPCIGGALSQLNIRLGQVDVISAGGHRYGYEFFRSQMPHGNNGGLDDGVTSGLINEKNWTKGQFQYYVIDCSRRALEMENVPQEVSITGDNKLNDAVGAVGELLLYCFVIYKRQVSIDIATSDIVG